MGARCPVTGCRRAMSRDRVALLLVRCGQSDTRDAGVPDWRVEGAAATTQARAPEVGKWARQYTDLGV